MSRFPIIVHTVSPKARDRWYSPALRCDIQTPAGLVHVNCVHLYTLRKGLDAIRSMKWKGVPELKRVIAIRNEESDIASRFAGPPDGPTLVLGDFNTTGDSTIFQRDWGRWQDAFISRGFGFGYTFATRKIGLRIDHVLADPAHWNVVSCHVGPDFRGQHRPLVAELLLRGDE
jgi:endonuclease/exonuclease/phosphatase (EEP) superfamily protein YafD